MKHLLVYIFLLFLTGCKFTMEDELITRNCSNSNAIVYTVDLRNSKTFNFILNNLNYLNSPITWQTSAGATLGTSSNGTFSYTFVEGTYIVRALYRNLCGDNVTLSTSTFTISKICAKPTDIRLVSGSNGKYIFNLDGTTTDVASVAWKTTNSANILVNQITNTNINNFETTVNSTGIYKVTAEITTKCGEKVTYNASFSYSAPVSLVKDIYICGHEENVAIYWKNGIAFKLTHAYSNSVANSIQVVGNDVFIAGKDGNYAKYWKNGVGYNLTNGENWAEAKSIFIKNGDIYVAGNEFVNGIFRPRVWKNGVALSFPSNTVSGSIFKLVLDDHNNIYVSGSESKSSGNTAKYWRNGISLTLSTANDSQVRDIDIDNQNVYTTGSENYTAAYWKNGEINKLSTNNSYATSMVIRGLDIYICGFNANTARTTAVYWKNKDLYFLESDSNFSVYTNSISVVGSEIFIVGGENRIVQHSGLPFFWRNGKLTILSQNANSAALDLFITSN